MSKETLTAFLPSSAEPGDRLGKLTFSATGVTRLVPERFLAEVRSVIDWTAQHQDKILQYQHVEAVSTGPGVFHVFHTKRLPHITYPHEWVPEMLRDAASAHCEVLESALEQGLFIKDPHPWNVLFEGPRPMHIDIGSFVNAEALKAETYLHSGAPNSEQQTAHLLARAYEMMFGSYFLLPLLAHSQGLSFVARRILLQFALNCSPRGPQLRDYVGVALTKRLLKAPGRGLQQLKTYLEFRSLLSALKRESDALAFARRLKQLVSSLQFPATQSAYLSYYQQKSEWLPFTPNEDWKAKQSGVAAALAQEQVQTVLDLGCNTGWYSELAAQQGKQVLALDEDEDCLRSLYERARSQRLPIVPLFSSLCDLPSSRTSIHDGSILLQAPEDRYVSDMVLALGLFHHLVLGRGLATTTALELITRFARKVLVLEWVSLKDSRIVSEPSFFAHLGSAEQNRYDLPTVLEHLRKLGWHSVVKESYPAERSLLVCTRNV